jgi:NAD-specific glutamate dehydrogenase
MIPANRKCFRFDENYGLAFTQSLKNKDIPEGGAKGTILPSMGADPRRCFEKYVDVYSIPPFLSVVTT